MTDNKKRQKRLDDNKPTFGLIVERDQLNATSPHWYWVEVGRVYPHASGVGPYQMTLSMSEALS